MALWSSLFLPSRERDMVADLLKTSLQALGYTSFNPFGLMPGRAYPQAVRLFVAPEVDGWVRVIGAPDDAQLPMIAQSLPCLLVMLSGGAARIEAYADGAQQPLESALQPYRKPGISPDALRSVLSVTAASAPAPESDIELLRDAMPEDVRAMSVNAQQAQKMFERLSANLTRRSGNVGNEAAARELLRSERVDWSSAGGAQIRAVLECLTVPAGWDKPDFVTLRDAYQLHERRRRNPAATQYPGDAEAMAAVPDALNYAVVYAGKG